MKIIYLEGREPFGMYLKVLTSRNFLILISYFFKVPGKCKLTLDTHKNWVLSVESWLTWRATQPFLCFYIFICELVLARELTNAWINSLLNISARNYFIKCSNIHIRDTQTCAVLHIPLYTRLPPANAPSHIQGLIHGIV